MDTKTKTRIEYEHQLFGFSSDSILDSFKDLHKETCDSAINSMARMLKKKLLPAALDANAVEQALEEMADTLKSQYSRGADYGISKVEARIRECFHIPDNLLLPEDQMIASVENIDDDALEAEIDSLRQELKNIAFLLEETKDEITMADETISVLEEAASIQVHSFPDKENIDKVI